MGQPAGDGARKVSMRSVSQLACDLAVSNNITLSTKFPETTLVCLTLANCKLTTDNGHSDLLP